MYSNLIEPLFCLLFEINTFKPILSDKEFSKSLTFASFDLRVLVFFLKILTKFSACLTESFLSKIFSAINSALSNPTKILACPVVIFFLLSSLKLVLEE